ncbi:MAG: LysM peptidoglycan-binding domain-containing protein [Thermoguttaceae bacterium]
MLRPEGDQLRRPDGTYVVQPNDSFWSISQKLYKTGAYYEALLEHNRKQYGRADQLRPGEVIVAPPAEELARLYPHLCPQPAAHGAAPDRTAAGALPNRPAAGRVYVVQEGDTLYDIARQELGKAARWAEIYELNREVLGRQFDYLTPGMQLILPEDGSRAGPMSRRPGLGLMR